MEIRSVCRSTEENVYETSHVHNNDDEEGVIHDCEHVLMNDFDVIIKGYM